MNKQEEAVARRGYQLVVDGLRTARDGLGPSATFWHLLSAAPRPRMLALLLTAIVMIAADVGALPECLPSCAEADLTTADLKGADLTGAILVKADLTRAVLSRSVLVGADLRGANLRHADLIVADLTGATLASTVLGRVNLTGAILRGANLTGATSYYSR